MAGVIIIMVNIRIKKIIKKFRESLLIKILIFTIMMTFAISAFVYFAESSEEGSSIDSFGKSVWYSIVTMTTTGYGDIVPKGLNGRIIGIIGIILGVLITAVASAVITSVFVEKKLQEGRGLKDIKLKDHIIICGWNKTAESVLDNFIKGGIGKKEEIVLVNELEEEEISTIISTYKELDIQFVKGDFVNENVLIRAGITRASSVILLADDSQHQNIQNTDERTILASMAINSLNPKLKTSAQLLKGTNAVHLKRANVNEIIIDGEFSGFLISNAATSPGIHQLVQSLLSYKSGSTVIKHPIPRSYVGKKFSELYQFFMEKKQALLMGVITEKVDMSLDDVLSNDYTAIDSFIRRKFAEAKENKLADKNELNIKLNPGNDYLIDENDMAFIITGDMMSAG